MDISVTHRGSGRATASAPTSLAARVARAARGLAGLLELAAPLFDLGLRAWVASVFFRAGLVKIQSWSATLGLFENVYEVPLLPPQVAALMGTGVELGFPVLLALGVGGRFAALVLFVFNAIAVVSYPDLSEAGLKDHVCWGLALLVTLFHGPGRLSIDHALRHRFAD